MSEYIFIKDLSFSYPDSSVSIFENLSLSFYEGWTVISGANGAGKSTLFSLIQGSIVPDGGIVRTSGEIAYCPQVFDGLDYMDIAAIYDGSQENGRLKSMLSITDSMIENPAALSGGEKKRLQLLAAFSHHPSIMLMDEPTNSEESSGDKREILSNAQEVIELLRKTHWLADGMKATDSECDDRMLAINP